MNNKELFRKCHAQISAAIGEIDMQLGEEGRRGEEAERLLRERKRLSAQLREIEAISGREERRGELQPLNSSFLQDTLYKNILNFKPGMSGDADSAAYKEGGDGDPSDERMTLEEVLEEMDVDAEMDEGSKEILLSGCDIFLDLLITGACSIARNRNGTEVTKEDLLTAMSLDRKIGMHNHTLPAIKRDVDKEHLKKVQMIKRECRKGK